MTESVPVLKDANHQQPVPSIWRPTLSAVVEAFKDGDFGLNRCPIGENVLSSQNADGVGQTIVRYGATLASLPDDTWATSACQWMGEYWDVLVDLFTVEEGASDLALAVRVREHEQTYCFEILSVHVP